MTRSDRERREAEKVARRAKRLADRAEQRAHRKGEQAQRAADRAEDLAERAYQRRSPKDRSRDLDRSIEDYVDDVADKWSRKAEDWIDDQTSKLFGDEDSGKAEFDESTGRDSAEVEARRARRQAEAARRAAEDAESYARMDKEDTRRDEKRHARREKSRRRRARYYSDFGLNPNDFKFGGFGSRKRRSRRYGNLYRDTRNKKILGVCAGSAEYLGMETWQVRLGAVLGLIFIPSLAFPAYFITYFLMDNKPYYREMSDRYDERHEAQEPEDYGSQPKAKTKRKPAKRDKKAAVKENGISNVQALRTARRKFSGIEDRLRLIESHVTSSQFELQREFKKISGDE